jgi:small subunit ribosomal protein S21
MPLRMRVYDREPIGAALRRFKKLLERSGLTKEAQAEVLREAVRGPAARQAAQAERHSQGRGPKPQRRLPVRPRGGRHSLPLCRGRRARHPPGSTPEAKHLP